MRAHQGRRDLKSEWSTSMVKPMRGQVIVRKRQVALCTCGTRLLLLDLIVADGKK